MKERSKVGATYNNLDRLSNLLSRELEQPALAGQIPDEAHIFHGSYDDNDLTRANLELASRILSGMALGYVEDAPLARQCHIKHVF